MARKKISEFRAKAILYNSLRKNYFGVSVDLEKDIDEQIVDLDSSKRFVVKVDQGIKQRNKKGLIYLNIEKENIEEKIRQLSEKGYRHFIVEEFLEHDRASEKYFAIERVREGKKIYYSNSGGVDIEENKDSIKSLIIKNYDEVLEISNELNLNREVLSEILSIFDDYYFSFLEINPLVIRNDEFYLLDIAAEVDSASEFFIGSGWSKNDFRENDSHKKTNEEIEIEKLKEKSPASFSYQILNPDGSIFLLLSGGGASLVTADEIYQKGKGDELSNYGEYSGNPNSEETYIYTKNLLTTLLGSKALKKAIIISGGVANFTDVRSTFKGIIKAMSEASKELREDNVKVFVRRGGPYQEEGLANMRDFLEKEELLGVVSGPEMILTDIVSPAIEYIS